MRHLRYTKHARQRMAERNVTEDQVSKTIQNHHTTYTDPDGNRSYVDQIEGRQIRVVIVGDGVAGDVVVITVIAD